MEVAIARAIRKIRSASSRKETELRAACDEVLEQIGEVATDGRDDDGAMESAETTTGIASADKYHLPLVLATKSSKEKIKVTGLDTLQKLIAYGYLRGEIKIEHNNGEKRLVDVVIESICHCRDDPQDNVQLQVIKALLTAVTSNTCRVRGLSLLAAVRSVYHIYLSSKNSVNKNTAKAALTQMVNIVIQRMEAFDQRKIAGLSPDPVISAEDAMVDADKVIGTGNASESHAAAVRESGDKNEAISSADCMYDSVKQQMNIPNDVVAAPVEQDTQSQATTISGNPEDAEGFTSVYHRDAFLLFRALCRLSMKGGGDENEEENTNDAVTVSSKILSLELLLSILNHAGETFRTNLRFLTTIRQYLCVSLLNNCMHSVSTVVSLSLRLFLVLVKSFKNDLLPEIEVFVSNVFSRILESPNADHEHKVVVLYVFDSLCQDSSIVMELFLNYDCISNRGNVFEKFLNSLGSIAQGRASEEFNATQKTAEEAHAVQSRAMHALASLMNSITVCTDMAHSAAVSSELAKGAAGNPEAVIGKAVTGDDAANTSHEEPSIEPEEHAAINGEQAGEEESSPQRRVSHALATNYDRLKRRRQVLERAALKFRMKPSKGVDYMVEQGLMSKTPESIAETLHELRDDLDKTAIGEFLGDDKQLNKDTMKAYVDMMDFTGMRFDDAIRHYLSGFRLPGEAQKIDRLMEKFAERYTSHNPDVFPSADTAFILAYSVIMLQTDAHNPSIKPEKKMTKQAFVNNNRGIADGKDLPSDFLGAIYDSIVNKAISLQEDDHKRTRAMAASGNAKVRREAFHEEKAEILKAGEEMMIRQRASAKAWKAHKSETGANKEDDAVDESLYYSFNVMTLDHVRALFDVAWGPLLAVFSVNFETNDDPTVTTNCLKGLKQAVHVAGRLGMTTERDAFVSTLSKFTLLDQPTRQMNPKNVACVKAIVQLALDEGRYLGEAWGIVLMCLSQIARLQNIGAGGASDGEFFVGMKKGDRHKDKNGKNKQERARTEAEAIAIEKMNASYISAAVDEETIIRIFTSSVSLETRVLKEFVGHLCRVSLFELQMANAASELALVPSESGSEVMPTAGASTGTTHQASLRGQWGVVESARKGMRSNSHTSRDLAPSKVFGVSAEPRVFSLQKVVEIADYNMDFRPRVLWAQVWDQLSRFFTAVGCHPNVNIAMFAIDSLKQLSYKFLDQGELKHFPFQTKFLAPFHAIMEAVPKTDPVVRELILQVFANIVRGKAARLHSGWQTLFAVHTAAADDANDDIVSMAFETVHTIVNDHFQHVAKNSAFEDLVKCLVAFAGNDAIPHTVSLRAVDHLAALGTMLARGKVSVPPAEGEHPWYDLDGPENDDVISVSSTPPLGSSVQMASQSNDNEQDLPHYEGEVYQQNSVGQEDDAQIVSDYSTDGKIWKFADKEEHLKVWWPLLTGLAGIISDHRLVIRTRALNCMFALLRRFGPGFSQSLWSLIFSGVLLPLFDDVRHVAPEQGSNKRAPEDQSWLQTTCMAALSSLVRLQARFFNRQTFLLPELLKLLENCIDQDIEGLARIGVACLQILLAEAGPRFDEHSWPLIVDTFKGLFTRTMPRDLLESRDALLGQESEQDDQVEFSVNEVVLTRYGKGRIRKIDGERYVVRLDWGLLTCRKSELFPSLEKKSPAPATKARNGGFQASLPFNSQRVITQCVVQLELISSVGLLAESHLKGLTMDQLKILLDLLENTGEFARRFNADRELRQALWRAGFMRFARQSNKLPSLLRQETSSTSQLLNLLLRLYRKGNSGKKEEIKERKELAISRLKTLASGVVWRYVKLDNDSEKTRSELRSFRQEVDTPHFVDREVFREAAAYAPLVLSLLDGILAFTEEEFKTQLQWLYDLLLDLIQCGNHEVRDVVRQIFDERVRHCLFANS